MPKQVPKQVPKQLPKQLPKQQPKTVGPLEPVMCLWRARELAWQLAKREIAGRYRGSALGPLWPFIHSIALLAVYTFVFGYVFQARWDRPVPDQRSFALMLFAGLVVYWLFSDCVSRAPDLVRANSTYVTKVRFPLEILPWTVLAGALFQALVSLAVLLGAVLWVSGPPPWTALWLPLIWLPFLLLTLGVTWIFASLGVYLPDVRQAIELAMTGLLFVSPIFYPISAAPKALAWAIAWNPLSFVVSETRGVLLYGESPDWSGLGLYALTSWLVAWVGLWWFMRTRKGFADVL